MNKKNMWKIELNIERNTKCEEPQVESEGESQEEGERSLSFNKVHELKYLSSE